MSAAVQSKATTALASRAPGRSDAGLESALQRLTLADLEALQDILHAQLRAGLPPIEHIAGAVERLDGEVAGWLRLREPRDEAVKVVILLGVLAVAIAWLTYRHVSAPTPRLQDAIATMCQDHVYMLPIPRNNPCFCGSGGRFRACHGKVPHAAPLTVSARATR